MIPKKRTNKKVQPDIASKITKETLEALDHKAERLSKVTAIEAMSKTEGARVLIDTLFSDVVSNVRILSSKYTELTHVQMIGLSAEIEAKMNTILAITRSGMKSTEIKKELDEELKQSLEENY